MTSNHTATPESGQGYLLERYALELDSACFHLGAERGDLQALLLRLLSQQPSRVQVQRWLETAGHRLARLRQEIRQPTTPIEDADIAARLTEAAAALTPGRPSLSDADAILERAWRDAGDRGLAAETIAAIRASQALLAATGFDFRHATALYADAAASAGLGDESRHRYLTEQASMLEELGREQLDIEALLAAVDLLENRLLPELTAASRSFDRARLECRLGSAMAVLGQRQLGTRMTENAIAAFERAVDLLDKIHQPGEWAAAKNGLGNALGILGQRKRDDELLERSVAEFDDALELLDADADAEAWASTQNNLAAVLQTLGQKCKDAKLLKRAVDAYKDVLKVWTRDRLPLDWATTMNNLGTALRLLGEHRKGPRTLEQAVAAYHAALTIRSRERLPDDWAMTQNNLGAALKVLGERQRDPVALGRAVAAFDETLSEWTRDGEPMSWALTLANLGATRKQLAEINRDADVGEHALQDFDTARHVFRSASHAQLTELCVEQIAITRKLVDAILEENKT